MKKIILSVTACVLMLPTFAAGKDKAFVRGGSPECCR